MLKNPLNGLNNLSAESLELEDPIPDIWEMFHDFDLRFFDGILIRNGVNISWSPKMTQCAGLCQWNPKNFLCSIRLSKPLLQLRTRKDLVETLIHEMIHALLFVKRESDNRESHGPKFHENMFRINHEANLNISVYHSFHDEVRHYQNHVWRCQGTCRNKPPYFGYIRRANNRKPGPYDTWYSSHQSSCGGVFEKISEPKEFTEKQKKITNKVKIDASKSDEDIRKFFNNNVVNKIKTINDLNKSSINLNDHSKLSLTSNIQDYFECINVKKPKFIAFSGVGNKLGSSSKLNLNSNDVKKKHKKKEKMIKKKVQLDLNTTILISDDESEFDLFQLSSDQKINNLNEDCIVLD